MAITTHTKEKVNITKCIMEVARRQKTFKLIDIINSYPFGLYHTDK